MAFAPNVAKKWFENLSVEELEAKYEELKKNYQRPKFREFKIILDKIKIMVYNINII